MLLQSLYFVLMLPNFIVPKEVNYQAHRENLAQQFASKNLLVVRILVSGVTNLPEKARWVKGYGSREDLLLFIDQTNADEIFGVKFMTTLQLWKQLRRK